MAGRERSFFQREPDAPRHRGRLILISVHFPPAQTAGALRWRKLAHYAAERGFGLDVVTLDPANLAMRDDEGLADLPAGIRVFGVPEAPLPVEDLEARLFALVSRWRGAEPDGEEAETAPPPPATGRPTSQARSEVSFSPGSPRDWARAYWAWVGFARGGAWARRAEAVVRALFDPERHRLLVTCGPPHAAHEAGERLSRRLGLPLVMDLRDPWSLCERVPEQVASPVYYRMAARRERRALAQASLVAMNTEPARDAMRALHPEHAERILAVPNAVDERPLPEVGRDPRLLIVYAGTLYLDRTPLTLFRAAARLAAERSLGPEAFGLEFMGHMEGGRGGSVAEIAEREGIAALVRTHPPAAYAAAERLMAKASILVSLPQDSHLALPSKVFDYMRFEATLLAFAEPGSATARHLEHSGAEVVRPDDVEGTLAVLRRAHDAHRAGLRPEPLAGDPRFSRRAAADRLFDALDALEPVPEPASS